MKIRAADIKRTPALSEAAKCEGARWVNGDIVVDAGPCYEAVKAKALPMAKGSASAPAQGPGTELAKIIKALGLKPRGNCQCASRQAQMNIWGADGCREHFDEIVKWMREIYPELTAFEKLKALPRALAMGINPLRPIESMAERAITAA